MLLVLHDFVEKRDSGSYGNVFHRITLHDVLDSLELVVGDIAVEFIFIFNRFLIFHLDDLTSRGADGFAAEVLQRVQHFIVIMHI